MKTKMSKQYQSTFKSGKSGRVTHNTFEYFDAVKDARRWMRQNHYVPYSGDAVNGENETWVRDIVAKNVCSEGDCESPYGEISASR